MKNCYYLSVQSGRISQGWPREAQDALALALNTINRVNLKGLATADQWTELVNEYFLYAEDEEGHEE